ncbi:hypothetical protein GCM10010269_15840 [Streptomyces humidus]|uniref:Uncharacterized protein n=1 Tax=Streptomyces humidus TaxID=52259 RepID=A0A918FSN7_9ACTN|nr:hypothetical protein GCM10010269_15840 [Streptomyces humidus]
MLWQWIGLAVFSVTLLPVGIARLTGRVPQRLRPRLHPTRPRGLACLAFYAAAPLNAIPALALWLLGHAAGHAFALTACAASRRCWSASGKSGTGCAGAGRLTADRQSPLPKGAVRVTCRSDQVLSRWWFA